MAAVIVSSGRKLSSVHMRANNWTFRRRIWHYNGRNARPWRQISEPSQKMSEPRVVKESLIEPRGIIVRRTHMIVGVDPFNDRKGNVHAHRAEPRC